jgi:hypothetical protein
MSSLTGPPPFGAGVAVTPPFLAVSSQTSLAIFNLTNSAQLCIYVNNSASIPSAVSIFNSAGPYVRAAAPLDARSVVVLGFRGGGCTAFVITSPQAIVGSRFYNRHPLSPNELNFLHFPSHNSFFLKKPF